MNSQAIAPNAAAEAPRPARARWREFCALALRFWVGETRRRAWTLTGLVALCIALQLGAQLSINEWNRKFFDALESKNVEALSWATILLPALVAFSGLAISGTLVARMTLQMRWREWLTEKLAGWWLEDQRYYRLEIAAAEQTSPEYRISKDVQLAVEPLVEFAVGFLTALATALAFVGVLWTVGGALELNLFGARLVLPGYLGFAAVVYATIAGGLAYFAGRPLVPAVAQKNEAEAQFLAELTRLKENAESIALIRGDADELSSVLQNYRRVAAAWIRQIHRNGVIATVQSANGALTPLIPLVLVAPKYLTGALTLGAVMQLTAAFVSVQIAFNWFIDNSVRVAEWMASANRVDELVEALESLDIAVIMEEKEFIDFGVSHDDTIHLEDLAVAHRNGRIVIAGANVVIPTGEKLLVAGPSGTGKSTLVRALAGLWPWGSGRILLPKDAHIAFVPQKPYIPLGTLRQAMLYSISDKEITDDMLEGAMRRCGLGYLVKHLDEAQRWDQTLSGGERQRTAFVRLLLERPQIIIMDEATSALDEESQVSMLRLFNEDLAGATVISVGHRVGMEDFHDKKLVLERRAAGAHITSRKLQKSLWHLFDDAAPF
ncbi:MAG: ABC transporter ATP-binding protein/permease [Methylocystis sp.]|uniref:ABC transporter ATP-binding protein/permease n=1 Tax=Methylocystis sp. TaxID=1911079 RepID=UPI003DA650E4